MIYTTYAELAEDIKNNLWKVPRDIDGIIAIERSGIIPATMISKYCNIGICMYNTFINYKSNNIRDLFNARGEKCINAPQNTKKYLVIDDTVCSGKQMTNKLYILKEKHPEFEYITCVIYLDNPGFKRIYNPDIVLAGEHKDLTVEYEWSLFSTGRSKWTLFDFDGVFVFDPPSDDNIEEYEKYLKDPKPKFNIITKTNIGYFPINICSYRIKKYYKETLDFLVKYGYKPGNIYMYNADTIEERNKVPPYVYKASVYKNSAYQLFVESNDYEAQMIAQLTGKPVISIEGNKLYQL